MSKTTSSSRVNQHISRRHIAHSPCSAQLTRPTNSMQNFTETSHRNMLFMMSRKQMPYHVNRSISYAINKKKCNQRDVKQNKTCTWSQMEQVWKMSIPLETDRKEMSTSDTDDNERMKTVTENRDYAITKGRWPKIMTRKSQAHFSTYKP